MRQIHLYIPLTRAEYERLCALAWAERRSARDHAALLLTRSLGIEQIGPPATDRAHPLSTRDQDDVQPSEGGAFADL